ncbi:substrate-binding domain-containing protein [Pseudarthrobacter oxydans]|uniref:substrate-binding domain-containing protein n=1 Tax=Pseudarthrobacter oxydans TaxID=1671 RepID=UPI0027D836E5|nr:substrate-binding domain-containing protein [Pseudarthrobacter oxydans]
MRTRSIGGALACILLAGIGAAGCSSKTSVTDVRGSLTAIGTPVQQDPIGAWSSAWTKVHNATSVNYSPDGSEVGISALSTGQAYFAALDTPLTQAQQDQTKQVCGPTGAFSIPVSITSLGVAFNMPSVQSLKLSPAVLAGIFSGEITRWDAAEIIELNPGTTLPSSEIVPVTAAQRSAETTAATRYLSSVPEWTAGVTDVWPKPKNGIEEKKLSDIGTKVDQTAGAIAFMTTGANGGRFDTALMSFGEGFVRMSKDSTAVAAKEGATRKIPTGVEFTLPEKSAEGYALGVVGYQAFCPRYKNGPLTTLVKSWGKFVLSPDGQVASTYFANVVSPSEEALRASNTMIEAIREEA